MKNQGLHHWGDIVALIGFFAGTMAVAIWSMCRPTRKSVKGYFLAGGKATVIPIGLSLFASNISSEHFIGFAGSGAASGIAVSLFEWNAVFLLLLMAWAFLPVYLVSGVYTLPEYLYKRFGGQRLRMLVSLVFILSCVLVPADLYSGGIFIQKALGWNLYAGIALIVSVAAIYSLFGGLSTVMYTDAIQVIIMLAGAVALTIIGFIKVGGYWALKEKYMLAVADSVKNATLYAESRVHLYSNYSHPEYSLGNGTSSAYPHWTHEFVEALYDSPNLTSAITCGLPREDAWSLFRDPLHGDFPWPAVLLRMSLGAIFYWCAHQTIVQRVLAAKNIQHAKGAAILAGGLKITPLFFMVLPGMISRVLFPNEVGCADPETCMEVCGSPAGCSNVAYPILVMGIMPAGMRGLMMAVMLAAVISSLTSMYNSVATVVTMDLWLKLRPSSGERELLIVGRFAILLVIGVSVAWIPVLQNAEGGQMLKYITAVFGYLGAPLSATFLVAMFWPWATEQGSFWGFLAAAVAGLTRFILDTVYQSPRCGQPDNRPAVVALIHPYYFTGIQVVLGIIITVVISLFTEPPPKEKLNGLTFWTRHKIPPIHVREDDETAPPAVELTSYTAVNGTKLETHNNDLNETYFLAANGHGRDGNDAGSYMLDENKEDDVRCDCKNKLIEIFCGVKNSGSKSNGRPKESLEEYNQRLAKLHEPRSIKILLNLTALCLICIVLSLYYVFR